MTTLQLYTIPDVAKALKVSESKVWSLVAQGVLKSVMLGGNRRVTEQDLRAFISAACESTRSVQKGSPYLNGTAEPHEECSNARNQSL